MQKWILPTKSELYRNLSIREHNCNIFFYYYYFYHIIQPYSYIVCEESEG